MLLQTVLRKAREEAGYSSSRAFFNRNGGIQHFGCSYRHYLNIESGKAAPGPKVMEKIALGLGLVTHRDRARLIIPAYLRSIGVSTDMVRLIMSLSESDTISERPKDHLVEAMARVNKERSVTLSVSDTKILFSTAAHYWTFAVLANDTGSWSAKQIADLTGTPPKKVSVALAALVKLKLARKERDGTYRCPQAGKVFRYPNKKLYPLGSKKLRRYRDAMVEKRGEDLLRYCFFSRGTEAGLRQYMPHLVKAVEGAEICSTSDKGHGSIFFQVEVIVQKVLPF